MHPQKLDRVQSVDVVFGRGERSKTTVRRGAIVESSAEGVDRETEYNREEEECSAVIGIGNSVGQSFVMSASSELEDGFVA